ncbi:MAG TPA: LuxR C-terminal-related transcriptional regulator [Streptosporangiaceae bacterium]|nr:LuxR C-terminal-related transcriptional regulator [Streptosporangiaceae bacterium]
MQVLDGQPATARNLTPKEMMIVSLLGAGRTTSEIATLLESRPRTVENRKRHIYDKLGVGSEGQAVAMAVKLGLIEPGQQRPVREPGRPALVVLMGSAAPDRDEVAQMLLRERVPFVTVLSPDGLIRDDWVKAHRGPLVVVLVDPREHDWLVASPLHAPIVEIRSRDVSEQLAIAGAMALKAGGLVAKADAAAGLSPALAATAQGMLVMSQRYAAALMRWAPAPSSTAPQLTARERDILDSIARGQTIRQTARSLGIATKTVENIQTILFRKLGARNRRDALTIAHTWGLIERATSGTPTTGPPGPSAEQPWRPATPEVA